MKNSYPSTPLADLCTKITKGTTPTTLGMPFVSVGVNFVKSEAIKKDGRIDPSSFAFIGLETHARLKRSILEEGDVLFSMAGVYLGKTAVIPASILPANTNQAVGIIRVDKNKASPRFIHYALSTPTSQEWIMNGVAQSAQPNFNLADIGRLPIPLISLPEQRAIAHILGTLDDKIELNRKMNETLEAMARALFKSWFVDFDPVVAKAEGRRPEGMDSATAALFPDSFEDSELGPIPRGWRVGTLSEIGENTRLGISPSSIPAGTPYIGLEHMPRKRISLDEWGLSDDLASGKFLFKKGDILFGKLRSYFHKVGVATLDGVCSTDILVLRPKRPEWFGFLLGHASSTEFVDYTDAGAGGTRMPRTNLADMGRYKVVLPPATLAKFYTDLTRPIVERIINTIFESHTLAALLETLLPKLLLGEIRVPEAEKMVGEEL